jgi:hypothetical protein
METELDDQPELELDRAMPKPTQAEPGSAKKIEILQMRVMQFEELHHPDDLTVEKMANARKSDEDPW